jgi:hypothetical protein
MKAFSKTGKVLKILELNSSCRVVCVKSPVFREERPYRSMVASIAVAKVAILSISAETNALK